MVSSISSGTNNSVSDVIRQEQQRQSQLQEQERRRELEESRRQTQQTAETRSNDERRGQNIDTTV